VDAAVGVAKARDHRERQIVEVLGRYGLSYLGNAVRREPRDAHTEPENLRLAPEELGPTFIKLGQLLSTRADLLSPDYREEVAKLQDAAPAVPSEVVEDIVARELHAPADDVFATFDRPRGAGRRVAAAAEPHLGCNRYRWAPGPCAPRRWTLSSRASSGSATGSRRASSLQR
jgi:predicted unusual protein kinase regulating ubiquinone biosynthesis (AarF/ABC1/UbiB family)